MYASVVALSPDVLQRMHRRVGSALRGKYRLEALLGVGGTAAVYRAIHRNGTRVALKFLHPELARIPEVRERFLREAYAANRVGHPGVVRVIDDEDDDTEDTVVLVLELLDGETVQRRCTSSGGRLPLVQTLALTDALLDVLAAAHDRGVVHRDIKPDNLFVTASGQLRVLDFGIARLLDGTTATRSGQLLGTPPFMSPEQANGRIREIDARSDVWSVGAVFFTLLTGRHVHEARDPAEQLIYAATQPAVAVATRASWLPRQIAAVVDRALAFDREARWPSARGFQSALRLATGGAGPTEAPLDRHDVPAVATVISPSSRKPEKPFGNR